MLGIVASEFLVDRWHGIGLAVGFFTAGWILGLSSKIVFQAMAIGGVGILLVVQQTRIGSENDLRVLIGDHVQLLTLEGKVASLPVERAIEDGVQTSFRTQFTLEVNRIRVRDIWIEATGRVWVQINTPCLPTIYHGKVIQIHGALQRPETARIPGGFDYRRYLRYQRIYYQVRRETWDPHVFVLEHDLSVPLPHRFQSWARETLSLGQDPEGRSIRLVWAMVLGWRTWLTPEAKEPFMRSGTLHLFAISGLHVALIAGFLVVVAKTLRVPRRVAAALIIPILWFYTLATGAPASAIRASTIASVVLMGRILHRPPDPLNSIGLAALLLLAWQPLQLFQPGFQLSFTVVTSLLALYPRMVTWGQGFFVDSDLIPEGHRSRLRRFLERCFKRTWGALCVSFAAWLGSAPLIALYFNLITPLAIAANLILVPLASLTMASALMSLSVAPLLPSLAVLANSSAWFWMEMMIRLTEQIADLPGVVIDVASPSVLACLVYYQTLFGLSFVSRFRTGMIIVAVGMVTLGGSWIWDQWRHRDVTTLSFLPIPRADAILIDSPGSQWDLIIDGGPVWSAERYLIPFLDSSRAANFRPDYLLTHGDKQHVEVVSELLKHQYPEKVYMSPLRFRSTFYRQLIESLDARLVQMEEVSEGDTIGPWTVLFPAATRHPSPADEAALVLLGKIDGFTFLLLSDFDRDVQKEILSLGTTQEIDILSLNLPAELEDPNLFVLRHLNPRVRIVTGSENGNGSRWVRLLENSFARTDTEILFTGSDGTIIVRTTHNELRLETMRSSKTIQLMR